MVETLSNQESMNDWLETTKHELADLKGNILKNNMWEKKEVKKRILNLEQFKKLDNEKKFKYLYDKLSVFGNDVSWWELTSWREPAFWFEKVISLSTKNNRKYSSYWLFKKNWMYVLRKHRRGHPLETVFEWDDEAPQWKQLSNLLNNWYNLFLHRKG